MKRILLSLVVLLISVPLIAHVLILRNGKKVEGILINEDSEAYKIQDSQGIIILVKKSQVDAEATSEINKKIIETKLPEATTEPEASRVSMSIAEIAREANEKKPRAVRTLRKEDLDKMPEVSIIGTEEMPEQEEQPELNETTTERTEEDWKRETRRFGSAIGKAKDDSELLAKECENLGRLATYAIVDPTQYILINGVWVPISGSGYDTSVIRQAQEVCFRAEQAKKALARIEEDLERFQDYARREGALPGWVDPERLP